MKIVSKSIENRPKRPQGALGALWSLVGAEDAVQRVRHILFFLPKVTQCSRQFLPRGVSIFPGLPANEGGEGACLWGKVGEELAREGGLPLPALGEGGEEFGEGGSVRQVRFPESMTYNSTSQTFPRLLKVDLE